MPQTSTIALNEIAYARSGDKGAGANIGVIAFTAQGYAMLKRHLTPQRVQAYFAEMNPGNVIRYEMDNLGALNFLLPKILNGGGSTNLRSDAQGKSLGQQLLQLTLTITDLSQEELTRCRDPRANSN
jgi:hypothetical protein